MVDFEGCKTHGPWGFSEGNRWVYMPPGFIKKIRIIVKYGEAVDTIGFQTKSSEGGVKTSSFGSKCGQKTDTICIDYPNEYIMSISGTLGNFWGNGVVKSICFMTNLNLYGPYGHESGSTNFSYDVDGAVIVGFHGRANEYHLTAFGVYTMPKSLALVPNHMPKVCSSMSSMALPKDAGPWGAGGGKPWDDGVFSTIKQVRVHVGELNVIYALQFEYLKSDAKSVSSQIHGGTDGLKIELVNLDGKDEYLTGISGFYGPIEGYNGLEAIVSITFHTNLRIHGPFGEERGAGYVYFSSTASPGKVVGFHGRNNGFLSAIGVHMEYF
ncbi:hypothetical protein L1987_53296 [Smallanthus sonchifolius]|uniref:Uncharacterized protein n=1 Tax=Smallanthus sonchifolius TaxID=185202 RepID=A0ACB9EV74_9ASTR|nr:hypothetical protein L1987_53296 [Smallanthus sonchifolius]